ncbi:hypothetical protein GOBAR_AA03762 [Gossypium barbadense]|uniref:Uncharacterized protein n=1 Tax=Gossypium barbadense TaxID=3634 RepID=A0A2P5YMP5_GOSBA|nr:hypothetical protein GOBAR_AA03762 [Gossypium barbadense]
MRVEEDAPVVVESWRTFPGGVSSSYVMMSLGALCAQRFQRMKPPHELDEKELVAEPVGPHDVEGHHQYGWQISAVGPEEDAPFRFFEARTIVFLPRELDMVYAKKMRMGVENGVGGSVQAWQEGRMDLQRLGFGILGEEDDE